MEKSSSERITGGTAGTAPPGRGAPVPSDLTRTVMADRQSGSHQHRGSALDQRPAPSWRATYLGADELGTANNISWGAVLAGVAVGFATLLTLSFIGASIGLGLLAPTSSEPFQGVGLGVGLWSVFTLVVSLGAGGFVAGALGVRAGFLHGLTVWAVSAITAVAVAVMAISGVLSAAGSLVGSVGSALGSGVSAAAGGAGTAVQALTTQIGEQIEAPAGLDGDVQEILRGTGVPELQPEYLQTQVDEVQAEVTDTATQLVTNPESYEQSLSALSASVQQRADTVATSVDREAIAASVEENTDLTGAEAQAATDNAVEAVETANQQVQQGLQAATTAAEEAQVEAERLIEEGRQVAADAADAAARAALYTALGFLLAAVVASFAGLWGSRLVVGRDTTGRVARTEAA